MKWTIFEMSGKIHLVLITTQIIRLYNNFTKDKMNLYITCTRNKDET